MDEIQTRDFGRTDVHLGFCVNVDESQIGPQIFKQVQMETSRQNKIFGKYKQVEDTYESRDFLGVSMGTILKIKAGSLIPDGPTEHVLRRSQERAPDTVEIMLQIIRENVVESMAADDKDWVLVQGRLEEIGPYTHYVQSVTFGAELIATITITHCNTSERPALKEWTGIPDAGWDKVFQESLDDLTSADSNVTVRCHVTGCDVTCFQSLKEFRDLLENFQTKPISKSAPLKFGMRPVRSVPELEDKPTVCREEDQEFTRELQDFEEEYDDLCESTDILKNCLDKNKEMLKKNRPFGRELRILKADVAELKQEYEDCIKLDQTRDGHDQKRLVHDARQRYQEIIGQDNNFAKEITSVIDNYVPIYRPENFKFVSEEEWREMINKGYTDASIQKHDKEKVNEVDSFMERVTLPQNRLQHFRDRGIEPSQPNELRIVLIGKTGGGKSATGNMLLGRDAFDEKASLKSVTRTIKDVKQKVPGTDRTLHVVDTPGLFDTDRTLEEVKIEIAKTLLTFPHGVHAFIYVMNSTERFTEEEHNTLKEIKDLFGKSFLDHTIVLFTRADSRFNLRQYIDKAHSTELLSPEENDQSAQTRNQDSDMNSKGTSAVHKFLTNDVNEHIMGLDNLCQSEYQKMKTRGALVELIDVVQTANGGRPFSHVYFDKAQQKLVRRKDEEKQAREDFLQEELKLWNEALDKAEKESDRISDSFWKGIQRAILTEEQQKGHLTADTITTLHDLTKGIPVVRRILEDTSCISLWSLCDCVRMRIDDLSKDTNRFSLANYVSPANTKDEESEVLKEVRENFQKYLDDLNAEIELENTALTAKILEDESKEDCKLAYIYTTEVAHSIAESYLERMSLPDIKTESTAGFTDTRKKMKEALMKHLLVIEAMLSQNQLELEHSTVKERVVALTTEALAQLKEKDGGFTFNAMKWLGFHRKHDDVRKPKYHVSSGTTSQETNRACLIQAVDFLVQRQVNTLRLQAVEAEYTKSIPCHQIILQGEFDHEIGKKYEECFDEFLKFPIAEGTPTLGERVKSQFAEVYARKLLLQLEEDPDKGRKRGQELDEFLTDIKKERDGYETKISEMTDVLINVVCRLAPDYVKSLSYSRLKEVRKKDYSGAAKDLSQKVLAELSTGEENQQLQDETKSYFSSGDKIGKAIKTYAKLNHEILKDLAKEAKGICFPAEATVVEEMKGEMKICEVQVGDKLLATTADGTLTFQDVFVLSHADSSTHEIYVELQTEEGASIRLSRGHLIHVGYHGNFKAARDVVIGDTVFVTVDFRLRPIKVTGVTEVLKRGAYCPHTTGGSVVVNNILASCYTDIINHQVAHVMLLPTRMLYHLLPSGVFNWMFLYDEIEEVPKLLLKMKNLHQLMW